MRRNCRRIDLFPLLFPPFLSAGGGQVVHFAAPALVRVACVSALPTTWLELSLMPPNQEVHRERERD